MADISLARLSGTRRMGRELVEQSIPAEVQMGGTVVILARLATVVTAPFVDEVITCLEEKGYGEVILRGASDEILDTFERVAGRRGNSVGVVAWGEHG